LNRVRKNSLRTTSNELLAWEETIERQRSCIHWLTEADRKREYIQARAMECARTNHTSTLLPDDGSACTEQEEI
jgi:hypothetical protein